MRCDSLNSTLRTRLARFRLSDTGIPSLPPGCPLLPDAPSDRRSWGGLSVIGIYRQLGMRHKIWDNGAVFEVKQEIPVKGVPPVKNMKRIVFTTTVFMSEIEYSTVADMGRNSGAKLASADPPLTQAEERM